MDKRVVLHCDCNSFFASVEMTLDPSLRGIPMAVGGSAEDRRGIILAKNEEAKRFHVETAETIWSAQRKCPGLRIVPPHFDEYVRVSHETDRIFERYTDKIERFGIDEAWLDVTGSIRLFGSGKQIADDIRETVKRELGITVSVGVSFNKVFAKLGSDYKKPDATTVIDEENYRSIVFPLPVESLLFIGRKTTEELHRFGIVTVGDLADASPAFLTSKFGKMGAQMHAYANGEDDSPVTPKSVEDRPKSVGNGMTFRHDLLEEEEIKVGLLSLSEEIAARLRHDKMLASTLAVTVKGNDLHTVSRQHTMPPTAIGREIFAEAHRIVTELWRIGRPIRALTVTATGLFDEDYFTEQCSFFDAEKPVSEKRKKIEKVEGTLDEIRAKFGHGALVSGAVLYNDIGVSDGGKTIAERRVSDDEKKK